MPEQKVIVTLTFDSERAPSQVGRDVQVAVIPSLPDLLTRTDVRLASSPTVAPPKPPGRWYWLPTMKGDRPTRAELDAATDITGEVREVVQRDRQLRFALWHTLDVDVFLHSLEGREVCIAELSNGDRPGAPIALHRGRAGRRWRDGAALHFVVATLRGAPVPCRVPGDR
ncbi:MAG TPA: hypothetical protein VI172_10845 [Candidatus Dormibacteraeota bacterium]|jgi:hypothetical protein